jgi:hypothetical protein
MLVSIFLAGTGLSGIYNIIKHLPQFYDTFKDDFLYSYFSRWYDKIVITMTIISFFALCLSLFILPCLIFIYYYDYLFLIYRESYSIYNEIITIDYIANNILNHRLTANFAAYLLSGTLLIPIILFILIMIMVTIIKLSTESIRETVAGFLNGITGDGTSNTTAFITLLTFISSIVVTILFPTDASNSNAIDDKKGIQVETVKRDSI